MIRLLAAVVAFVLGGVLTFQSGGALNGAFFLGVALATSGFYCTLRLGGQPQ